MSEKQNDSGQEKTEEATPQRRDEFRKRGDVFQSKEITSVLVLSASVLVFYIAGVFIIENLTDLMRSTFSEMATFEFTQKNIAALIVTLIKVLAYCLLPLAVGVVAAGLSGNLGQVGFLLSTESLKFDLDRVNPVQGFKRLVNVKKLVDALKAMFKLVIIGGVAYLAIKNELSIAPGLVTLDVKTLLPYVGGVLLRLVLEVGALLVVLSILDFMWERQKYEQKLKMTKQELKEDLKQREGDPLVKSRIRSIQRSIATKRMMEAVPRADVIITNPTHIAIALIYDREKMPAPKVVAKGAGFIAEKIKNIAKTSGVPVVVNKPLAQVMFRKMKIGQFIPKELFEATAQVLAYIYKLKGGFAKTTQWWVK